jgi:hypothetical protein
MRHERHDGSDRALLHEHQGVPIRILEARHPQLRPAVAVHDVRFVDERHVGRHEAGVFGVDVVDVELQQAAAGELLRLRDFGLRHPRPAGAAWRGADPVLPEGWRVIECPFLGDQDDDVTNGVGQVIQAEPLPYVDRRHVVCYQLTGDEAPTTNGEIPEPSRIDTGGGGTAT